MKTAARALKVVGKKRGVVTRQDLFAAGLTRHQVDGAVDAGLLTVIWRGVYLPAGMQLRWEHKLEAALRLTEPDGAVAGVTAAALLHIEGFSRGPLQIVIPEKRQFHPDGVKVLRSRDFDPVRDVWKVDGFRVTKVPRTLLDLAPQCTEQQLVFAIEGMLRKRRFLLVEARDYLRERSRGRPEVRRLVELISDRICRPHTDDRYEVLAERLMNARGLYPTRQVDIFAGDGTFIARPDFLFKDARVAVQVDGEKTHFTPQGIKKDQVRDANLKAARYFPFHTWPTELTQDPEAFLSRLEGVLASQPVAPLIGDPFDDPSSKLGRRNRVEQDILQLLVGGRDRSRR